MSRKLTRETTQQAADRHGLRLNTLYRRYERARERGRVTVDSSDFVGGRVYLTRETWDLIVRTTPVPGRPRKL